MESQGQPCLKGFPSSPLGAQPDNNQHGQNRTVEPQKKTRKHRLSFDKHHLSPQSKKQKDNSDRECFQTPGIDNSKISEGQSDFSGVDKNLENSSISISAVDFPERQANGSLGDIPSPDDSEPEETQEQTGGSPRSKIKEYISDEKTTNSYIDRSSFHGNISEGNASGIEGSLATDIQEPCDVGVSNESDNFEGIPGGVSSLGSDNQQSHVYVVGSPIDQHIPDDFHSPSNTDDNMKIHVDYDYGDISASHKDIESYNTEEEQQSEVDQGKRMSMKLDLEQLQLLNVGTGGVEYMENLPSLVTVKSPNPNDGSKSDLHTSSQDPIIVRNNDQKTSDIQEGIPIQVYPQGQGISLVTSSGILTADISTFSTQVPAILTEGDADDTDAAVSFADQFHVVTTSSALSGSSQTPSNEVLSVMMSSGDFSKGVILMPDQQQALLGDMIMPGIGQGQALHITIPQVATVTRTPVSASGGETTGDTQKNKAEQVSSSEENKRIKLQVISNSEDEINKELNEAFLAEFDVLVEHCCNTQAANFEDSLSTNQEREGSEGGKVHLCPHPDCNKVCQRAHKLKLHMLSHTGERPYKCSYEGCEWAFTTAYKLKRHERGHTGERPFMCPHDECNRRFTTAYNLKTHIRTHTRPNSIMCHYEGCDKTFPTLHKFRVHERRHQQEDKPFKCEVDGCGKEFSAMGTLTSHLKSHSGERPHGCPVEDCCKRFTKASKLKLHLRSHTGERPFACHFEGCGWSFTSAYKLKRHMRKHTGERPFVCLYEGCHKSFTRSSHLKTHTLVHTGEKPYVCPIDGCNKAFTAGSSLNVHMRKHTGEKPFKCEEDGCSKAYTTASNLRAHQKRHEKSAKCSEGESEDHPMPADFVTVSTMNSVSSASSLADNDNEVTYTGVHTFSSEDFTTDEVAALPVSVHFSTGSLSAIITNRGNPLSLSTACSSSNEHTDVEQSQSLQSDMDSKGITTVTLPVSSVDHVVQLGNTVDANQIDVAEFVVRNDSSEPALHGQEVSKHSDVDNLKHDGGFDLSITSMVSHLRSHDTSPNRKLVSSDVLTAQSPTSERLVIDNKFVSSHSRALEFRTPINPEDQFKPPAVIFQDECSKSGSSDTEGDSSQPCTNPNLMQITLPQEVIQVHFPVTSDSPLPPDNDNSMDVDVSTSHQLQSYEGTSLSINKPQLSPYMEGQSSPEPDDSNMDSYPESTINLQDLR